MQKHINENHAKYDIPEVDYKNVGLLQLQASEMFKDFREKHPGVVENFFSDRISYGKLYTEVKHQQAINKNMVDENNYTKMMDIKKKSVSKSTSNQNQRKMTREDVKKYTEEELSCLERETVSWKGKLSVDENDYIKMKDIKKKCVSKGTSSQNQRKMTREDIKKYTEEELAQAKLSWKKKTFKLIKEDLETRKLKDINAHSIIGRKLSNLKPDVLQSWSRVFISQNPDLRVRCTDYNMVVQAELELEAENENKKMGIK